MDSVGFIFGLVSFVVCLNLSGRVTKMERMLKKAGIGIEKNESLYNVLEKNIGKKGTLTYHNGSSLFGSKELVCFIVDVDEEWLLIEDTKKKEQQLLHIDSIRSVQF